MKEYIFESAKLAKQNRKDYMIFGHIQVQITEPFINQIDLEKILKELESKIPKRLLDDVDSIYIGTYEPLENRQIDSMYINGSILISNKHSSEKELFGTFVHEFAHAIEEAHKDLIYSDGQIAREFLAKRKMMYNLLKDDFKLNKNAFLDINFNQQFDDFAYKTVGYQNLGVLTNGLFISPYACTSIREYFANGFEHFFLNETSELKQKCPNLFRKIKEVIKFN